MGAWMSLENWHSWLANRYAREYVDFRTVVPRTSVSTKDDTVVFQFRELIKDDAATP